MPEAEEDGLEGDGDGDSRRPAAGAIVRAASSAAEGWAVNRAAAGENAATADLEGTSVMAADGAATTAAVEGAATTAAAERAPAAAVVERTTSKTAYAGVAARVAVVQTSATAVYYRGP